MSTSRSPAEIMPGDLEPGSAIAVAQLAATLLGGREYPLAASPADVKAAVKLAHEVLDATCAELCVRANAARRATEIARGSVSKGGNS